MTKVRFLAMGRNIGSLHLSGIDQFDHFYCCTVLSVLTVWLKILEVAGVYSVLYLVSYVSVLFLSWLICSQKVESSRYGGRIQFLLIEKLPVETFLMIRHSRSRRA